MLILNFIVEDMLEYRISDQWTAYKEEDVEKAATVKEIILNDVWWDKVDYIIAFIASIYDMLRVTDTNKPTLHLVYDMWDTMIEKVRATILRHEEKEVNDQSTFYDVVYYILIDRWTKSCTPLHCMAHSLNPRYYIDEWLAEASNWVPPHMGTEIAVERNKCLRKYFPNPDDRKMATKEFARSSGGQDIFGDFDSLQDRWSLEPKVWWLVYGDSTPLHQKVALKLLSQPCSLSCCERNWSTYSFIHSMKRNKMTPKRAEDLVYIHTNLHLLSRKNESYTIGQSKMWDIGGDEWDPLEGAGVLAIANSSFFFFFF
ncbi:Dimer_Tnp_hAT domain-containing protein [Quillaja saponaria]|uniref:Dimer_Tnp_hAT domain-containing protein n=1 Tax=Quillaja saponaria TaxID=32244 RepID=A0AAD7LNX9_QUISA|nr:Dimer_Tnp_hAT domain-containing protein [Quillaja saponaria]